MGQQEVYNLLKKQGSRWFTVRDLSIELDINIASITNSVRSIRLSNIKLKQPEVLSKYVRYRGYSYFKYKWNTKEIPSKIN